MADEKTTLKINKAVDYLEKINSKQDVQQTRSLNQKMVDSLTSIEKSTEETNQLLKGVELSNARKQKDNVSIFKTMLSKFFPKEKDMNRTDDNEEGDFRSKLLKHLGIITKNSKKDSGFFGALLGALGGILKSLFGGSIKDFIGSLFKLGFTMIRGIVPIIGTLAAKLLSKIPKIGSVFKNFRKDIRVWQGPRGHWGADRAALRNKRISYLTDAYAKENSKILGGRNAKRFFKAKKVIKSTGEKIFSRGAKPAIELSGKFGPKPAIELLGKFGPKIARFSKVLIKTAGPIGIAITTLEAGVTAISKIANAGALLGKAEDAVTVGDRVRAAEAGMVESVTFGLVSAEKFIEIQDKISDTIISGSEAIFGKNITNFGRNVLNFFDVIVTDFTTWLTGGNFWSEWRTGWDYLKNNFTDAIADMFSGFWDGIKNGLSSGVNWAYNALGGPNNPIIKWFKSLVSEVTEGWNNLYNLYIADNPVFKFFKNLGTSIADSITGLYDSLINKIKNSSVGKYLVGAWDRAKAITESTGPNKNETKNTTQTAQAAMRPAQVVRNDITYKNVKEAEKARSSEIHTNVSNAFKMNKNTAYNNLSGDDKRLAVLMNFLLEQFAPYMSQLNAEAEKEDGNIQNVALVNPMR